MIKKKVVVIGLDGVSWDILMPLIEQGRMPFLGSYVKEGAWGVLQTTLPPLTCPAWFSFSTGKNPGKLGIFHFVKLDPEKYSIDFTSAEDIEGQDEVWDVLNKRGFTTGIANNPVSYPVRKVDGYMIAGFMAPPSAKVITYPEDLQKELEEVAGGYEIDSYLLEDETTHDDPQEEFMKSALRVLKKRTKVFKHLLKKHPTDFRFLCYTTPDRVAHHFFIDYFAFLEGKASERKLASFAKVRKAKEMADDYFEQLDRDLGEVLALVDKDALVVFASDHGSTAGKGLFYINRWFVNEGYLALRKGSRVKYLFTKGFRVLKRMLKNPRELRSVKTRVKHFSKGTNIIDLINSGQVDWNKTKVFSMPGGVYFNKISRPEGIVEEDEVEALRGEIIEKLKKVSFKDPKGEKEIKLNAFKPQEIWSGDKLNVSPDLYPVLSDDRWGIGHHVTPKTNDFLGQPDVGQHSMEGIFAAAGPGIKKGKIKNAQIIDVIPTLLEYFGVKPPEDMDGKVLREVFSKR